MQIVGDEVVLWGRVPIVDGYVKISYPPGLRKKASSLVILSGILLNYLKGLKSSVSILRILIFLKKSANFDLIVN